MRACLSIFHPKLVRLNQETSLGLDDDGDKLNPDISLRIFGAQFGYWNAASCPTKQQPDLMNCPLIQASADHYPDKRMKFAMPSRVASTNTSAFFVR